MPATTFEQFCRFSTDAYGLERLIRFLQASLQTAAYLLVNPENTQKTSLPSSIFGNSTHLHQPLTELSSRLGLVRRFLRFFRFLDAFSTSYDVFTSLGNDGQSTSAYLERTIDGLAGTFNGLYLLLEAVTLVDALNIPGLAVWSVELESALKIESQRCWLFALVAGALACMLRLSGLQGLTRTKTISDKVTQKDRGIDEKAKLEEESARISLMGVQKRRLTRKMVACVLDMALPGSVVGWIPASKSSVAIITLVTSVLTGADVWERCGKEVGKQ